MLIYLLAYSRDFHKSYFYKSGSAHRLPRVKVITKMTKIKIKEEIARVDEKFVSVSLTWGTILDRNSTATTEKRIAALTKALSPAYVRIGGIRNQYVIFQSNEEEKSKPFGKRTLYISGEDLDRINQIAEIAGLKVVFSLSFFKRSMDGSWDPSNGLRILKYVAERGYKFGWELGNGKRCMIFAGWEVCMVKTCDLGLENAAAEGSIFKA